MTALQIEYVVVYISISSSFSFFFFVSVAVSVKSHLQRGPGWSSLPHIQERGCQHSGKSRSSSYFPWFSPVFALCVRLWRRSFTHTHTPWLIKNTKESSSQLAGYNWSGFLSIDGLTESALAASPSYIAVSQGRIHELFITPPSPMV